MKKILFLIAFAAMIWSACSKSYLPDPVKEHPVFSITLTGELGDTMLTAGKNNTYLFTRFERGLDEVLVMTGSFADVSCPMGDCPSSVRFEFRNINQENNVAEPGLIFQEGENWELSSIPDSTNLQLNTVAVQWVTRFGQKFRSDYLTQPSDSSSYFHILNSEPWETNERGETTWKMDVDFSCKVIDSFQQNPALRIFGSGVIAVGYR